MTREKLKKEAEWAARQPKARQAKSKARTEAYEELKAGVEQRCAPRLFYLGGTRSSSAPVDPPRAHQHTPCRPQGCCVKRDVPWRTT